MENGGVCIYMCGRLRGLQGWLYISDPHTEHRVLSFRYRHAKELTQHLRHSVFPLGIFGNITASVKEREKSEGLWLQKAAQTHTYLKSPPMQTHIHTAHVGVCVCTCSVSKLAGCLSKLCGGEKKGRTAQTPVIYSINFLTSIYKAWYSSALRFSLLLTCFRSQIQLRARSVDLFVLFIFSIFRGEWFPSLR